MGLPDEAWLPAIHSGTPPTAGELTQLRLVANRISDAFAHNVPRFVISGGIGHRVSDILREGFNGLIETIDASSGQITIRLDQLDQGLQALGSKVDERAGEILWLLQFQNRTLGRLAEQGALPVTTEAQELRRRGEQAYQRGHYKDARGYFRRAAKLITDDFAVYRSLGHLYHRHDAENSDAKQRALKCYRRAARYALPDHPAQAAELKLMSAIVLSEMSPDAEGSEIDEAIRECSDALDHNRELHAARYWRAKLRARHGVAAEAAEDLKAVVEADAAFFTQATRDPDLCGGCRETRAVIEELRQRAERWVRPALEMLVATRDHYRLPADLDAALDAATERLVAADRDDTLPATRAARGLYHRVQRLSRSLHRVTEFPASSQGVFAIGFSPDGRRLATADAGPSVKLWDCDHWAEIRQLDAYPTSVICLAFAPDGRFLVTGGLSVRLWNASTGREEHQWEIEGVAARVTFVRDGGWLIWQGQAWDERGGWDVKTRAPIPDDALAEYWPEFAGVTVRDGEMLLRAVALNRELHVSRQPSGDELWRSEDHPFNIDGLAISPDGRHVVTGCADGLARVFSVQTGKKVSEVAVLPTEDVESASNPQLCPAAPCCLSFDPTGQLAAGCGDGMVRVWQLGFERRYSTLTDAARDERVEALLLRRPKRSEKPKPILSRRTGEGPSST